MPRISLKTHALLFLGTFPRSVGPLGTGTGVCVS
jgi:hypothetical protein